MCAIGAACTMALPDANAQPSQRPLLVSNTGARPNLLFTLDNSGSMSYPFPDNYRMRRPGSRDAATSEQRQVFFAQRSSTVNPMYYNPRITYAPRLDANNQPLPDDGIRFVSNAGAATTRYRVFSASVADAKAGGAVFITDANFPAWPPSAAPNGWASAYDLTSAEWAPVNQAHGDGEANPPPFTYLVCQGGSQRSADTLTTACQDPSPVTVDILRNAPAYVDLPTDHQRTDCPGAQKSKRCSHQKEVENILNWFRYYRNRMEATKTALGQAFQSSQLTDGAARVGYRSINMGGLELELMPKLGQATARLSSQRGVRPWVKGPDKQQFYQWLYGTYAILGTPMRTAYQDVGEYFRAGPNAVENPWAGDPSRVSSNANPELSCRRSFQVALSDGGWNDELKNQFPSSPANQDATEGPTFARDTSTAHAPVSAYAYKPKGLTGKDQSRLYVPYPGPATGGLADLAANYFWHTDLRPQLPNQVPTSLSHPTYWQNLRTYAIGYMIRPSGGDTTEATAGLTFHQINSYRNQFLLGGYDSATQPHWPKAGDDLRLQTSFSVGGKTYWTHTRPEQDRIDDFIQSGYTGGGRSFSVQDPQGIRKAIDAIFADILDASGNDAGIALGGSSSAGGLLDGRLKFKVDYRTTDNMGDITAQQLDSNGKPRLLTQDANGKALAPPSETFWSAQQLVPAPVDRRLFSLGDNGGGVELQGRLDKLPAGVRTALRNGPHADELPDDESFIDYLRGKDPVIDKNQQAYRLRASPIGAIVNSAPVLLGVSQHQGYDDALSAVSGKDRYADFRTRITLPPDTLFAATNAGVVHALNTANGKEIAAYLPRRSLRRLLDQAQSDSEFRYVLDGPLSTHDVYDGTAWSQLVVGSGGRGERLVYALRPRLNALGEAQLDKDDYLWETNPEFIDAAQDGDNTPFATGHMTNPARSGQTDSGAWVVVLNSGHYNGVADGKGHGLVVLNALTGAVLRTITLPEKYAAGRGLGGVTLVRDTRKRIVAAYAGDAMGQLWRFDLRGQPADWKVSYGQPLFTTEKNRPIYAGPAWQAHPKGGMIVVVATGILLQDSDATDTTQREAIYGIWDPTSRTDGQEAPGFQTVSLDRLLEQKVETLKASVGDNSYYSISRNKIDWQAHKGWKLLLGGWASDGKAMIHAGERVIEQLANTGSSVLISSVVINRGNSEEESCTGSEAPGNAIYVLNALDGAGKRAFDHDKDGRLDEVSMVFVATGGYARGNALVNTTPEAKMSPAQKYELHVATQDGESSFDNPGCRGSSITLAGVGNGLQQAGTECPKAWSRQQYQLTRLPQ